MRLNSKKRKRQHFYVPTLPLRAINASRRIFRESVESPKAAVDNKINASENAGIDVKNELTALFTDLYGLVGDVLSGNDVDTGELEVRFKNIFDGLFKLDADTVKTDPTADGVLKNDGFVASAAEVLWNYMDYYDTNRLKKQTESAGVTVKKDIPYISDGNKYHLLDIYYPENAAEKLPVIIDIHGGGLMYAEKRLIASMRHVLRKEDI